MFGMFARQSTTSTSQFDPPNDDDVNFTTKTYITTGSDRLINVSDDPDIADEKPYFRWSTISCYVGNSFSARSQSVKKHLINNYLEDSGGKPTGRLKASIPTTTLIHNDSVAAEFIDFISDKTSDLIATHLTLENSSTFAINPFDSKLGFYQPMHYDKWQMIEFLRVLLKPQFFIKPPFDLERLLEDLVSRMFSLIMRADSPHAKIYREGINKTLDEVVRGYRIIKESDVDITLVELTRKIHITGRTWPIGSRDNLLLWKARDIAHSLATPLMSDLYLAIDHPSIKACHTQTSVDGEAVLDLIRDRVDRAIRDYPCFASPTTINIDHIPAVAINLKNVLNEDASNNTLFLIAAHMLAIKRINILNADIHSPYSDRAYLAFYKEKLNKQLAGQVIAFEDINLSAEIGLSRLLSINARERKKLNMELIVGVHKLTDIESSKNYYPLIMYVNRLYLFSRLHDRQLYVFGQRFTQDAEVESDIALITKYNYFSYTKPIIGDKVGVVKTSFHPLDPLDSDS